jgi:hypothetical protein
MSNHSHVRGAVAPDLGSACDLAFCRGGPVLVGLVEAPCGLRLIDGPAFDLPEELLGREVPRDWVGLVVVAGGRCHSFGHPAPTPSRAAFAFALDRDGHHATFVTSDTGTIHQVDGERPRGHVVDVAHRLLDLPAPGEPLDPRELVAVRWLEELLDLCDDPTMSGCLDDWSIVAQAHPAIAAADGQRPADLAVATRRTAGPTEWGRVLDSLVEDGWAFGHLGPEQLARLDAASFSRFVMARHRSVHELWAQLEWQLPSSIAHRVRDTLDASGGSPELGDLRGRIGGAG